MTRLIFGTTNSAKLDWMRSVLSGFDIELLGLKDLNAAVPDVMENGKSPLENAVLKATVYYAALKAPVFSCDSALRIDDLPENLQPGVNVRSVNGKRLSDAEMIAYYAGLAHSLGGRMTAGYQNAVCLIMSENEVYSHAGSDISFRDFMLVDKPHTRTIEGFPLDSLSVHIGSGKYYYDLNDDDKAKFSLESNAESNKGFQDFFRRALKMPPNSVSV